VRFAPAQQVQVRAVQDQDLHVKSLSTNEVDFS
jgi:hypothetical protein